MLKKTFAALFTAFVALHAAPQLSFANDQDVWATTVPAPACQPVDSFQASKVRLSNGAYVFRGNSTGTVQFYCPLPLNAFTVANFSHDNDITKFRIFYRDSDGTGNAARVTARLVYRLANGLYAGGSTWNSNISNVTTNTTRIHNNPHDMRSASLYSFYVTLTRTNTSQDPAFSGIDFPFPAAP